MALNLNGSQTNPSAAHLPHSDFCSKPQYNLGITAYYEGQ